LSLVFLSEGEGERKKEEEIEGKTPFKSTRYRLTLMQWLRFDRDDAGKPLLSLAPVFPGPDGREPGIYLIVGSGSP
jgi:hypothetical protein